MTKPTVTRSRDKTEDAKYHARIARSLADGRAAFYARQGLTPPSESHVRDESRDGLGLPAGEPVRPQRSPARRRGAYWTCARDGCDKTFQLTKGQRDREVKGQQRFFCSRECYHQDRENPEGNDKTRIPVAVLQKAIADSGLEDREVAERLGWYKTKRNGRKFPDAARVRVTIGLNIARGDHYISTVRRATMDKFSEALGLPERWWVE